MEVQAKHINLILGTWFKYLEKLTKQSEPVIEIIESQWIREESDYCSVSISCLLTGTLDGKITLGLDFATVISIFKAASGKRKSSFDSEVSTFVNEMAAGFQKSLRATLKTEGIESDVLQVPSSVDTNVFYQIKKNEILGFLTQTPWGDVKMVLSLKLNTQGEKSNAA